MFEFVSFVFIYFDVYLMFMQFFNFFINLLNNKIQKDLIIIYLWKLKLYNFKI
jgi:hypothetical protein